MFTMPACPLLVGVHLAACPYPACAQELSAKTTWLAANGAQSQACAPGVFLACGCFTFVLCCAIAWGVLGVVFSIGAILRLAPWSA
jgi:hypothetical protein